MNFYSLCNYDNLISLFYTIQTAIINAYLYDFYSTFICPTEIVAFNEKLEEFKKINTEVVGCSVDSPHTHLAW